MRAHTRVNGDFEEQDGKSTQSEESGDDSECEGTDESESEESVQEGESECEHESSQPAKSSALSLLDPKEWTQFNEKIISMRPLYKSAKVQYINKLSRQIKALRQKRGDPSEVEKNQRKADSRVQEIAYIKGLKTDVIPKFALLHSKDEITQIVNSADSTMEYRVKAKVARLPVIARAAEAYHNEHPNWRETLFKRIQLAGKKMKKKRRKLRGKSSKTKKKSGAEDPSRPKSGASPKKPPKGSQTDDGSGRFDVSNFPEAPPGFDCPGREDDGDNDSSVESTSDQSSNEETDSSGPSMSRKVAKKSCEDHRVKNSKKPSVKKQVDRNKRKCSQLESEDPTSKQKSNVDPFFMTSDNKEYKTIWKVEPADSFKNKDPKKPEFMFKNARSFEDFKNKKGDKRVPAAGFPSKRKVAESKDKAQPVVLENLHPSWQAKKKLNVATAAFQGKKVVFDDDS